MGGQVLLAPLDFVTASSTSTPARRSAACSTSGSYPWSTKTTPSPTTRSASATTTAWRRWWPTWWAPSLLVLLTDAAGLFTADPRLDEDASLIEEIVEVDHALEAVAGGREPPRQRRDGLQAGGGQDRRLVRGAGGDRRRRSARCPGTTPWPARPGWAPSSGPATGGLPARKLWIAFAVGASGDGCRRRRSPRGPGRTRPGSLLPAGVRGSRGIFDADDAVEIAGTDGRVFAKGLVRHPAARIKEWAGLQTSALPPDVDLTRSSIATTWSSPCSRPI